MSHRFKVLLVLCCLLSASCKKDFWTTTTSSKSGAKAVLANPAFDSGYGPGPVEDICGDLRVQTQYKCDAYCNYNFPPVSDFPDIEITQATCTEVNGIATLTCNAVLRDFEYSCILESMRTTYSCTPPPKEASTVEEACEACRPKSNCKFDGTAQLSCPSISKGKKTIRIDPADLPMTVPMNSSCLDYADSSSGTPDYSRACSNHIVGNYLSKKVKTACSEGLRLPIKKSPWLNSGKWSGVACCQTALPPPPSRNSQKLK